MELEKLPQAVRESTFTVFGVEVRCCVLDNGQRVIDVDDFHRLFAAMETGDNPGEMAELQKWIEPEVMLDTLSSN